SSLALRARSARDAFDVNDTVDDFPTPLEPEAATGWLGGTAVASLLPPWLAARFTGWLSRTRQAWLGERGPADALGAARGLASKVRSALRAVRPRIWIMAAGGLGAVVVAVALVGADTSPTAQAQLRPTAAAVE